MRKIKKHSAGNGGGPLMLPKLCGADIELGNFVLGLERAGGTGDLASRALLREIDGPSKERRALAGCDCRMCRSRREETQADDSMGLLIPASSAKTPVALDFNPQDWGRKFLPANGGCVYIDLDHLELCLPEVLSAWDHVACWHAMLRVAQGAMANANEKLPDELRIQALVNNSDGRGNSYGSHLNFLLTRRAWDQIFERKVQYMLYLAAFQASSIVYTGQGKVGSENGAPPVAFQISQRADFFEALAGPQTTFNRPIVNSRDEALCGSRGGGKEEEMARLHVIFFDNTLAHRASLLKVGCMQVVLAMIEAERVNPVLILDDPVEAVLRWSHDPTLRARARLIGGEEVTAVGLQLLFLEEAKRFADAGMLEEVVPRAGEILALWEDTLLKLRACDFASLARELDWVLKLSTIKQAMNSRSELTWVSPEVKHLDHAYSNLDRDEGLYWAYEAGGFVERLVTEGRVLRFVSHPPADTRAWARAQLLRLVEPEKLEDVNWDRIQFRWTDERGRVRFHTLQMADPLGFTRRQAGRVLRGAKTLEELLERFGALEEKADDERYNNKLASGERRAVARGLIAGA